MVMKKLFFMLLSAMIFMSCSQRHVYVEKGGGGVLGYSPTTTDLNKSDKPSPIVNANNTSNYMPKATAFVMSGDYSNNVAITLSPDGNLIYFPAPSDITVDSAPVELGNGWWLNRQGLGQNSVFTTYTFEDYSKLGSTPSIEELKAAIIPGAKVVQFIELPWTLQEVNSNLNEAKEFVVKNNSRPRIIEN